MPRLFFVSICPNCRCANETDLRNMGKLTKCNRCHQPFVCKSEDSQSAALNSPMGYWVRYTAALEGLNPPLRDISRIPK